MGTTSVTFQFKIEIVPMKAQMKMVRAFCDHSSLSVWQCRIDSLEERHF